MITTIINTISYTITSISISITINIITIITIIIGVIVLIGSDKIKNDQGVPTILTAIGSAAIGALAGLLAPPPKGDS